MCFFFKKLILLFLVFFCPPPVHRSSVTQTNTFSIRSQGNIPGWVATVITQAVLLFGCCTLHFVRRPSSADPQWGSAHSIIFGSGGEMRLRVDPPSFLSFTKIVYLIWLKIFTMSSPKKIFGPQKKILSLFFLLLFFSSPPATLATLVFANYTPFPPSDSYLLGLLAKIKCSICSYQLNF